MPRSPILRADLHLQNFAVASNSKQVVREIAEGSQGMIGAIVKEIKTRATLFNCNFTFEGRAANDDPHSLTRLFFIFSF